MSETPETDALEEATAGKSAPEALERFRALCRRLETELRRRTADGRRNAEDGAPAP